MQACVEPDAEAPRRTEHSCRQRHHLVDEQRWKLFLVAFVGDGKAYFAFDQHWLPRVEQRTVGLDAIAAHLCLHPATHVLELEERGFAPPALPDLFLVA